MGVLDPYAFYKIGFARQTKGRNPQVEARIARQQRLVDFAYEVVGNVAVEGIQNTFKSMQRFRDLSDSQTSSLNLKLDKLPVGNESLKDSVRELHRRYNKAIRTSKLNISGKKRSAARQDMTRYMTQMQDLNAFLEVYKTNAEKSQGIAKVATGVAGENNKAGNKTFNPSSDYDEATNTIDQATGDMGGLLRWDIDEGTMYVLRGGEWVGEEGNRTYQSKGIQDNTTLKEQYKAYEKDFEEKQIAKNNDQGYVDTSSSALPQSYEDWAASQGADALNTITRKRYSEVKFARESDPEMGNFLSETKRTIKKDAYNANAMSWDSYSEGLEEQFKGNILSYNDDTFKDFYFGGYAFDYSTNRMDDTAPAYRYLKDEKKLTPPDDPNATQQDIAKWEGALLSLKGQSFVKGSKFRKQVAESEWQNMKDLYERTNAEAQRRQAEIDAKGRNRGGNYSPYRNYTVDGYTGIDYDTAKKQYDNMLIPNKVNYDRTRGYKYIADGNGNTQVYRQDVDQDNTETYGKYILLETIPTNEAIARRGLDIFGPGYTGGREIPYSESEDPILKNIRKKQQDDLTNQYLPTETVKQDPEMTKELKKLEAKKNRSEWYIDGVVYKDYKKAEEAIKAKYQ